MKLSPSGPCQPWLPWVLACLAVSHAFAADTSKTTVGVPWRMLLVTGGCCHDYAGQTEVLCNRIRIGDGSRPIEWTVKTYGDSREIEADVYRQAGWAEGYDLVVHNECFGAVANAEFVESIVTEHERTRVPAVVLHCSMHSYRVAPTDRWREFVGVTSRRHEQVKRPLVVRPVVPVDPLVAALGSSWETPLEELYIIEQVWPSARVMAVAYSEEEKADQPVIWQNQYRGVRVFGTTLGHFTATMGDPVWLAVVEEGVQWALVSSPSEEAAQPQP